MTARSSRPEVRNPILAIPAAAGFYDLDLKSLAVNEALYRGIAADARVRAQHAWDTHKAPQAAYWKAKSVDARHIAIVIARVRRIKREEVAPA